MHVNRGLAAIDFEIENIFHFLEHSALLVPILSKRYGKIQLKYFTLGFFQFLGGNKKTLTLDRLDPYLF